MRIPVEHAGPRCRRRAPMAFQVSRIPFASSTLVAMAALCLHAQQPTPSMTLTNKPCDSGPKLVGGKPDTLHVDPDAEGFVSLFDGKTLSGWWEHCNNFH